MLWHRDSEQLDTKRSVSPNSRASLHNGAGRRHWHEQELYK